MKTLLLVSNEITPEDPGKISKSEQYGLPSEIYNISNLRAVLQKVTGYEIKTVHHTQVTGEDCCTAEAMVLSGRFSPWDNDTLDTEYAALLNAIRNTGKPVLGICAGLQLIARAFGSCIGPMKDSAGEFGYTDLSARMHHPLLSGINEPFSCLELHRDEVKRLPEGFFLLAASSRCPVQIIAHSTRPIVGVQFHPELQTAKNPDGRKLLENFFGLYCGTHP